MFWGRNSRGSGKRASSQPSSGSAAATPPEIRPGGPGRATIRVPASESKAPDRLSRSGRRWRALFDGLHRHNGARQPLLWSLGWPLGQELRDSHTKGGSENLKRAKGDVALSALHRANIGSMEPAHIGQLLLGYALGLPEGADVVGEDPGDPPARFSEFSVRHVPARTRSADRDTESGR